MAFTIFLHFMLTKIFIVNDCKKPLTPVSLKIYLFPGGFGGECLIIARCLPIDHLLCVKPESKKKLRIRLGAL